MLQEFIRAMFLIFMAEMGDKTQILAIAFATKYKVKKVLMGIFIGSLLNHGLAVILGAYLSTLIPIQTIQIIAGFSFVVFALWSLKLEEDAEKEKKKENFGAVITVAIAFFIGELGDKTQLTTIMLAADARFPFIILMGTVSGMVITGGLGIIVGSKLGDKIPELAIKLVSASIFMFFGVTKLYAALPTAYINQVSLTIFALLLSGTTAWMLVPLFKIHKQGKLSAFKQTAKELYAFYHQMNQQMNHICLGESKCGACQKNNCIIGYTKTLIKKGNDGEETTQLYHLIDLQKSLSKNYDRDKIIEGLGITLKFIKYYQGSEDELDAVNQIRQNLEMLLFNKHIDEVKNLAKYIKYIEQIDSKAADQLIANM
ncbi:TMEM165/GDT1 family protein [Cellulosilyticum sp. I15G10I2]|uniref:TMEM165/GDT1 family protein n=1 Tax=Cellulosilyticum sp. I15G10I2 TaxID=1892843 RepID=UPI00085CA72C|nr:TMEM165/GDT1 family protein [Cellulosilyticum sp. I15G10I2]